MKELFIPGSQSTPIIKGDWQAGILFMEGDSYPENSYELYQQVYDWVSAFLRENTQPLLLELQLLYLNTSSIKALMDIFDLLEEQFQDQRPVSVCWRYDARNERVAELAGEFKEDCTFPFEITAT